MQSDAHLYYYSINWRYVVVYVTFLLSICIVLWSSPCIGSAIPSQQVWSWSVLCSTRLCWGMLWIPLPNPYPNPCLDQSTVNAILPQASAHALPGKCPPPIFLRGPPCNCPPLLCSQCMYCLFQSLYCCRAHAHMYIAVSILMYFRCHDI